MKVKLTDIKPEGSVLQLSLPQAWLSSLVAEAGTVDFFAQQEGLLDIELSRTGLDVRVRACGSLRLDADCAACLDRFQVSLPLAFDIVVQPACGKDRELPAEYELKPEELEQFFYEGDEIDLLELVREQIILALPLYPRCREDCPGLCPRCGANLNREKCSCQLEEVDSRWQVLKNLSSK
jgi:uncharacterized protein